jgi:formylglycine-generating enzyme required for sulfatase activity
VQRQPGLSGPLCRWIISYRHEFHGEILIWLGDVLRDAADLPAAAALPHDLSGPERFHCWSVPPLGAPPPGCTDPEDEATHAFLAAIEVPLKVRTPDGSKRYPWAFASDGAQRLARAFGKERCARLEAPLLPELQVVLAHLMERVEWTDGAVSTEPSFAIEVPDDPGSLIREALEDHLCRALDSAFPDGEQQGRTRALLALRELADMSGRREEGLPAPLLARAIGPQGSEILEKLATPLTRLVILERHPEGWSYALSHDRMAQVIVRAVEDGRVSNLAVDTNLLSLRRFVALKTELYRSGEIKPATRLPSHHFKRIAAHAEALIWDEDRHAWWEASQRRRVLDQRRLAFGGIALLLAFAFLFSLLWSGADQHANRNMLLDQIASGEPQGALLALDRLTDTDDVERGEVLEQLLLRAHPLDVLERGVAGIAAERRPAAVLRAVEWMLPLLSETPEDPFRIASMIWALDFFPGRTQGLEAEAWRLRERVLGPLRRRHPPPAKEAWRASDWAPVPGGSFMLGANPAELSPGESASGETPRHEVTLSAFQMLTHEVTNDEYRQLFPQHLGRGDLPAVQVNWYYAYTYAAWLGGRLPTEAEWEYAARAGCQQAFCDHKGAAADLDRVGWYILNASDPETMEPTLRPVAELEPNRWGLFDLNGSVWEWTASGFGAYGAAPEIVPIGSPEGERRVQRGGSVWSDAPRCRVSYRNPRPAGQTAMDLGFRVVITQGPDIPARKE